MKVATKVTALAVASVAAFAVTMLGGTVASAATEDCRTITTQFVSHEDWGNGSPQHWADDTLTRVTTVCHVPAPEATLTKKDALVVPVEGWVYSVSIVDKGVFTTIGGDNSPNNDHLVLSGVPGVMEGYYKTLVLAPSEWAYWNSTLNGSTVPAGAHPRTGEFVGLLFTQGDKSSDEVLYKWTYTTCNEQWVDASNNHDGQDNSAGDITGYSRQGCPVVTTKNNCDHTQVITLTNNAPLEKAGVVFKVDDIVYELAGGETTTVNVAADVEKTVVLVKGREGFKIFTTVKWEQPEGCTTASPTPSPSASETSAPAPQGNGDLPKTGANVSGLVFGGGIALILGVGVLGFLLINIARRRRNRAETSV